MPLPDPPTNPTNMHDAGDHPATAPLRVLVLSDVFPNALHPTEGLFVYERTLALARRCEVRVVAPIPWMLYRGRPRFYLGRGIPRSTTRGGLEVLHPRWFYVPRFWKALDGWLMFLSILPAVARLRRSFDFDVIQTNWVLPTGVAGVLLGRLYGRPVEITLRGMIGLLTGERARSALMRWVLREAAVVNAVSPNLLETADELGCDPAKATLISNGVNHDVFAPLDRSEARKRCDLPRDGRVILTVGNLNPRKGHHRVMRCIPELRRRHGDVVHVVAGGAGYEGDMTQELEGLRFELGLDGVVRFLGNVAPDQLRIWICASDFLCLSSAFEGWPNVLLEAMACGRPVVTSAVGAAHRIVPREDLGIVYEPFDSHDALLDALDRALRTAWDTGAITEYARGHSWERTAGNLYRSLLVAVGRRGEG